MNDSIFVAIPTMNDEEYLPTLERLFALAEKPERIFVGTTALWKNSDIPIYGAPFFYKIIKEVGSKYYNNVKLDILPWAYNSGVGNGRLQCLKHYNNEKYFLSIDSHTSFIKNWDSVLIDQYESAKKYFGKMILLTTYLPAYFPSWDTSVHNSPDQYSKKLESVNIDESLDLSYIAGDRFSRWQFFDYHHNLSLDHIDSDYLFPFPNDKRLIETSSLLESLIDNMYLPAKKISAHFTFTEASPWLTAHRINLSPGCFFWSEEFYQSSLAYARGYNFVWVKEPSLFHYYKPADSPRQIISNYDHGKKGRRTEEIIEYDSFSEKVEFYNKYLRINVEEPLSLPIENDVVKNLLEHKDFFGYLPRNTKAFMKYAKIDVLKKTCSPWWEVPDLDVIFK